MAFKGGGAELELPDLQSKNFFYKTFTIFTRNFKNRKWNYPNIKWNDLSNNLNSDKKMSKPQPNHNTTQLNLTRVGFDTIITLHHPTHPPQELYFYQK